MSKKAKTKKQLEDEIKSICDQNMEALMERFPDDDFITMIGFNECIIGVIERINNPPLLCYSRTKIIAVLCREMDHQEAEEYFEYNIAGAYIGEDQPLIVDDGDWMQQMEIKQFKG